MQWIVAVYILKVKCSFVYCPVYYQFFFPAVDHYIKSNAARVNQKVATPGTIYVIVLKVCIETHVLMLLNYEIYIHVGVSQNNCIFSKETREIRPSITVMWGISAYVRRTSACLDIFPIVIKNTKIILTSFLRSLFNRWTDIRMVKPADILTSLWRNAVKLRIYSEHING